MVIKNQFLVHLELLQNKIESFEQYPFNLPVVKHIKQMERLHFHPKLTYFVGENGSGKSTLLEAIAVANGFNPEGGTRNFLFGTHDSHSNLYEYLRIAKGVKPKDGFFYDLKVF